MPARVLLVDDDDLVLEVLSAMFEKSGLGTLVASSGVEAITLLEAGEIVDAMESDLSMPRMDGIMTIKIARSLRPKLPCFLLTGCAGDRAALSAEDSFTLIRKPVNGQALITEIEVMLRTRP